MNQPPDDMHDDAPAMREEVDDMRDPLTWNCPHIGRDGWGCGAAAGEPCDWTHDAPLDSPLPTPTPFHAERLQMAATATGAEPIPRELLNRIASDFVD